MSIFDTARAYVEAYSAPEFDELISDLAPTQIYALCRALLARDAALRELIDAAERLPAIATADECDAFTDAIGTARRALADEP